MRIIDNGYAITLYGGNKISISNPEGMQLSQGETSHPELYNEKKLKEVLKGFISLYEKGLWNGIIEGL